MRTLATALCLTVTTIPLHAQSVTRAPDFAETRRLIREGMAKDSVTAAAIAVVRDGAIIWEEAFGWADRDNQLAATPNTPFLLASLTKTFEATLAAVLHEQRRIDLDRPVNDYLRTTAVSSPVWDVRGTTIRRLLMHTGGLSTFDIWCDPDMPPSRCQFPSADETIRRYGIVAQNPGKHFDYSNLGFFVASEAIARAAGRPLRDLLRDEVFRPLGMTHTSLGLDSAEARLVAIPFAWGQGLVREQPSIGATDYASARGYASAHDLALFAAFHMKARRRDQRAILSDAAIDRMQYDTVSTGRADGQRYALGWWTEENRFGHRSVLAQGGNDRAQAWLRLIPSERVAVAVLINKGVGFGEAVTDAALASLLPRYAEGLAARERERGAARGSAAPAATPIVLDSTVAGAWTGRIRTADTDIPLELAIAPNGEVQALIGARRDVGTARVSTISGMLIVRIPGDLEAANPAGKNRLTRFYLRARGEGFGGHVTTRPPSVTGLDGAVTYWAEITRQRQTRVP
jgi:CubicO group peptidase (beta-lactamase class C family)